MTKLEIHIPTSMDIRREQNLLSLERESEFWLKKAEELQGKLEDLFTAAETGTVELNHRGKKIVLVAALQPS